MFSVITSDFYNPDSLHKSICFSFNRKHTKWHFKLFQIFFLVGKHQVIKEIMHHAMWRPPDKYNFGGHDPGQRKKAVMSPHPQVPVSRIVSLKGIV